MSDALRLLGASASSTATPGTTMPRWSCAAALVEAIVPRAKHSGRRGRSIEAGGMLAPGFVDLQVNGGGGVMLNDHPDCRRHRDDLPGACAVRHDGAAADADHRHAGDHRRGGRRRRRGGRGERCRASLGLHLEGPHLSHRPQGRARPGADPADDRRRPGGADRGAQEAAGAADHRRAGIGDAGAGRRAGAGGRRRQPRPFRRDLCDGARLRRRGRDDGDASLQRDEPDRQPRAGAGRRGARHRPACRPG